ncbi:hypothetical protein BH24CHL9_BH24CHL9_03170 [soil metagenome]
MSDAGNEEHAASGRAPLALDELIADVAHELEGINRTDAERAPGWQEHSRGGSVFARVSRTVLEVRLPGDIAEAALRTPDTSESPGRPGWVRFAPTSDEPHFRDRAEAWFRTAWRHAEVGKG